MITRSRVLALLSLLILATACTSPADSTPAPAPAGRPTEPPQPFTVTVVHTNDTWGYLLPCG
jgi:2',3'-cyclic-nucleotide 2'-phosphodiesterase (5'-nucleotidase family)